MSIWAKRRTRASDLDAGFTLIEVMVAIVMIGLITAGFVPMLVAGARASMFARFNTIAKNLTQERFEQMRSLQYHISPQLGHIDLMQLYYRDTSATQASPDVLTIPDLRASTTATGWYNSSGGSGGPSGPYYEVKIPQVDVSTSPALTLFSQVVYSQFLLPNNPVATPLPASSIPSTYNSTVAGQDTPPSLMLGVTVVTSWTMQGATHSFSSFTQMTDTGAASAKIDAFAKAVALSVQTKDYLGDQLSAQVGSANASGTLSNVVQALAEAAGGAVSDSSSTDVLTSPGAATLSANSPPDSIAAGEPSTQSEGGFQDGTVSPCGWAAFNPTEVDDVSAATDNGLPLAPSDVANGNGVVAALKANGNDGCAGSSFAFTPQRSGSPATDPTLDMPSSTVVRVLDTSGNNPLMSGSASVSSNNQVGAAGSITAKAGMSSSTWIQVFPGLPFLPTAPFLPSGATPALVNIQLSTAALSCASNGSPTGSYTASVWYYTAASGWKNIQWTWSSSTTSSDPLAAIPLSATVYTNSSNVAVPLSYYLSAISSATGFVSGTSSEVTSLGPLISLQTGAIENGNTNTTVGVSVGQFSCTAQDNR